MNGYNEVKLKLERKNCMNFETLSSTDSLNEVLKDFKVDYSHSNYENKNTNPMFHLNLRNPMKPQVLASLSQEKMEQLKSLNLSKKFLWKKNVSEFEIKKRSSRYGRESHRKPLFDSNKNLQDESSTSMISPNNTLDESRNELDEKIKAERKNKSLENLKRIHRRRYRTVQASIEKKRCDTSKHLSQINHQEINEKLQSLQREEMFKYQGKQLKEINDVLPFIKFDYNSIAKQQVK
jgi:hypothetical protein